MMGHIDTARFFIKAAIAFLGGSVAQKNTLFGLEIEFMVVVRD